MTLVGPRQSGKTTVCKSVFSQKPYVSLEPPDQRDFALTDPRGFLARYPAGVVIDEIQRAPACYLLGIRTAEQLEVHPLRGPIFECWVASEFLKHAFNRGVTPQLFFFRDHSGNEVDFIVQHGEDIHAIEVKAGRTASADYFLGVESLRRLLASLPRTRDRQYHAHVIYGGDDGQTRAMANLRPWSTMELDSWFPV